MFSGLFQPMHLLLILIIVLVIFGPSKLPQIGAGLGKGLKELKKGLSGDDAENVAKKDEAKEKKA